ncbi:cache domain-containing protein [Marinobacterium sp. xm-m-312]|uniref:cache domain-containing protein n=1 Tax=Marinobacterium sp. xm-m-312 TaxID=2497741 RepID=UPI001568F58E
MISSYYQNRDDLLDRFQAEGVNNYRFYQEAFSESLNRMSQSVIMVAHDHSIVESFEKGAEAVSSEGGGAGGTQAAFYRSEILEHILPSWKHLTNEFGVRQLHFHLPPGDTSFLRVHLPAKYGDDLSNLRHIIVDVLNDRQPRTGFELGRVYSGIRSVVPVNSENGELIGALEAGTSFSLLINMLKQLTNNDVAVLMDLNRVDDAMWQTPAERLLEQCNCFIEATTKKNPELQVIGKSIFSEDRRTDDPAKTTLIDTNGNQYVVTSFPIQDYVGIRDSVDVPVGQVVFWRSANPEFSLLYSHLIDTSVLVLVVFLILLTALWFGIRFTFAQLQEIVDSQTKALSDLHKKSGQLYATVAHELRNPVAAIDMIADGTADCEANKPKIKLLTEQLMMTLDDMQFAINPDLKRPKREMDISIHDLDETILSVVAPVVKSTGVRLQINFSETVRQSKQKWRIDAYRIRIAASNLIKNACLHSEGSEVEFASDIKDGHLLMRVKDNGKGIPDEMLDDLFAPFTRGDTKAEGTGMGLHITKTWIEDLGGTIHYHRLSPGSEFCIEVPLNESVKQEKELHDPIEKTSIQRELKVDLVDDDKVLRLLGKKLLSNYFTTIRAHESGRSCLQTLNDSELIITDLNMPEMDGYQLIEEARASGFGGRIVVLTGNNSEAEAQSLIQKGADAVIVKPLTAEKIDGSILNLIT